MTAPINWSDLVPTLNTGDILSFSGNDPLDYMIQTIEGEPYTHVGMVIKSGGTLYLWDAPGGGNAFPDPFAPVPPPTPIPGQPGARAALLEDVVKYYMTPGSSGGGGEIALWVRQVQPAISADQQAALMIFVSQADSMPFPGSDLHLPAPYNFGAGFSASWGMGVKLKLTEAGSFFCAQLLAQSYMAMGLLPIYPDPANAYDPARFNSADPAVPALRLGATLTPTRVINYPKQAAAK